MLKRALCTLAFVAVMLAVALPVVGQQLVVQVTSPEMGQEVRGMVPIIGSASVPSFQFYKVEFGVGANPSEWAVIGSLHEQPVINGQLEVWNTAALPDGVYTLRLQGVKQDGNWEEFFVRNLVVANTRPMPTPTPEVTETPALEEPEPEGTPQAAPTPTPAMTPTPIVIAPTRAPAQGTPTPTLTAPEAENESPFDVKSWGQSAMYGGIAMGAVFVLVGIVFGIRRLM